MNKIKFIAPRDIEKGEIFSFEELFSLDDNIKAFEQAADARVISLVNERLNPKKEQLENEFQERLERIESDNSDKLEKEVKLARKEAELEYKVKADLADKYETMIEQKDKDLSNIKNVYNEMLETKLDELRSSHKHEMEEKIKEIEDKKKSAKTIGDDGEDKVRDMLSSSWPTDRITKPNHATGGADVLHEINIDGEVISSIYYEVKNRKNWSKSNYDNFVEKVRNESHDFNIFISSALPKSSREQHIKLFDEDFLYDEINNVYLLTFDNWLPVIAAIRNLAIKINEIENTEGRMEDIKQRVYDFFKSPDFKNYYSRTLNNIQEVKKHFSDIKGTADKGILEASKAENEINELNIELEAKYK